MKAYGVVKKRPTNVIMHTFKVEMTSPKQNQEVTIQRDFKDKQSITTFHRKSAFERDELSLSNKASSSISPNRKHRLFQSFQSKSLQKVQEVSENPSILREAQQLSVQSIKKESELVLPLLRELISRESQKKQRARLKSQSILDSPVKIGEGAYKDTPMQKLNCDQTTRYIPTRDINKTPESNNLNSSSKENTKSNIANFPSHIRLDSSLKDSISSCSVVNVGCCGEESDVEDKRQTIPQRVNQFYISDKRLTEKTPPAILRKHIFSGASQGSVFQNNCESLNLKSNKNQSKNLSIQESRDYKLDKIKSRPQPVSQMSVSRKFRNIGVTVFRVRNFDPFEF